MPQKARRSVHPSSNPGHPSGFQNPIRPTSVPEALSSVARRPYPRKVQWPTIIARFRHAIGRASGWPSPMYRITSGSPHISA